jgi:hypothetical protein
MKDEAYIYSVRKYPLGRPRWGRNVNIKMDLTVMDYEDGTGSRWCPVQGFWF